MSRPIAAALAKQPLDRPPVWVMRQAGRYLPEYRSLRAHHRFQDAVADPDIAAEITLQPIRRFGMDGAVIFADIMTPLEAMGVEMTFDPGPRLRPHSLDEVVALPLLDPGRVAFVAETIERVASAVESHVAVIGFAGAPATLLAYLMEGGGSKDFMRVRGAIRRDPETAGAALANLARSMHTYLDMQRTAGAHVVQLFDSWAGLFDRATYESMVVPSAQMTLAGLGLPTIYFAPGAGHTLDLQAEIGADGYGVDWRIPIDDAWKTLGDVAVQGNVDPAVLLADRSAVERAIDDLLARVAGRPGHIVNLGHGIDRHTDPAQVAAMVERIRS